MGLQHQGGRPRPRGRRRPRQGHLPLPGAAAAGGAYDLLVSATDTTTAHVHDFLREVVRFDVETARPAESLGPVAMGGTWRVDAGEESPDPRFRR